MHDVAVERVEVVMAILDVKQIGTQRYQFARAARRAVEPAEQLLAARLGCKMQVAGAVAARLRVPRLDRLLQPFLVRAVVARQRPEEGDAAGLIEMVITVEHLARDRSSGCFAGAGQ